VQKNTKLLAVPPGFTDLFFVSETHSTSGGSNVTLVGGNCSKMSFHFYLAERWGSFAHFIGKTPGDLRDDDEVETVLAGDAGAAEVAADEGVVGKSTSNSHETFLCIPSTPVYFVGLLFEVAKMS
jgi:hypothetical protein